MSTYDELALHELRIFSKSKLVEIAKIVASPTLEVGPSVKNGARNSPVFEHNPEYFLDFSSLLEEKFDYQTLDIDPLVSPNYLGSIEDEELILPTQQFASIICFSILEHCLNPFAAVANIHKSLRNGGEAFFLTPWDLRFHGPRPDCWRISDDGYKSLFKNKFEIVTLEKLENPNRPLSPYAIYVHAQKI